MKILYHIELKAPSNESKLSTLYDMISLYLYLISLYRQMKSSTLYNIISLYISIIPLYYYTKPSTLYDIISLYLILISLPQQNELNDNNQN